MKDEWGIPALHISQKYTDNEYEMAKDATATAEEVCRGAGFEVIARHAQMVPPGESIHELGTCRMGSDPKKSVLNGFNQTHDVKNLYVIDGGAFRVGRIAESDADDPGIDDEGERAPGRQDEEG